MLAGELRLIIADHDITTKPGEVAGLDTPDGGRLHVRAAEPCEPAEGEATRA